MLILFMTNEKWLDGVIIASEISISSQENQNIYYF